MDQDFSEGNHADVAERNPKNSHFAEEALNRIISRLTSETSELAMVRLLPKAKELYEGLHPEKKHGGPRANQVTENGTWPSFVKFISKRAGLSPSTVYAKLDKAKELETLDAEAETLCYGSALANNIGLVARIARIPKKELQRDIVTIYAKGGGPKKAKEELQKWEHEFDLSIPPKVTSEPEQTIKDDAQHDDGALRLDDQVQAIIDALGVDCIDQCVPAIESLRAASRSAEQVDALPTDVIELRERLLLAEVKAETFAQELRTYRTTPLGKLYRILGVKDVRGALEAARRLTRAVEASPTVSA